VTFPDQFARTYRFTAGVPRDFTVSPDGRRVVFTRSGGGFDPVRALWTLDVPAGAERLVADPATLPDTGDVPAEERARRERARDTGGGVTRYATDDAVRLATFGLSGRLWVAALDSGEVRELPAAGPVVDPRPDPGGRTVAYVSSGALRVIGVDGTGDRALAGPEGADVGYGLAEFVAAEEMGRDRGYWWSPEGDRLLVARVDNTPVQRWYISDPADPGVPPAVLRYPVAGTANAEVTLWLVDLDGNRTEVRWDRAGYEYVIAVHWNRAGLVVAVQNRAQTSMLLLAVDPDTGDTRLLHEDRDPAWVMPVPGLPDRMDDGALVWAVETGDTRHLVVDGRPVTPAGLQLRQVLDVDGDTVLFTASDEPTEVHLWAYSTATGPHRLTGAPGVYRGRRRGGTLVVVAETPDTGVEVTVRPAGGPPVPIASLAETPVVAPRVHLLRAGEHEIRTAVLFPTGHVPGSAPLPVLMDPYGGPGGQRVLANRAAPWLLSQWFADQGFAVVVADGRGTPGRGPAWDRTIHHDKASLALEDQVTALHAAAGRYPDLDLTRVGIRGWSYGGFLAAMAVLRRPDVFHVAVAGAPATDQRLYDTYYQERYLGHPDEHPEVYRRSSLLDDAPSLRRPLMLIHGLADDNVVPAHTLRLSAALLAAGRPHTVLPLSRATHLGGQPADLANMLLLQLDFLSKALARPPDPVDRLSR
jgi:dipeptidyl-peptidase-4